MFDVRNAAEVRRIGAQDDAVAAQPADELEGSRADRSRVERNLVEIRIPASRCAGRIRRIVSLSPKIVSMAGANDALHVQDDGIVVGRIHGSDLIVAATGEDVVARIQDRCHVNLTSLLVNGAPSCHLTPWRKW